MKYDNDENVTTEDDDKEEDDNDNEEDEKDSGDEKTGENTKLTIINATEAPLEECKLNVLVELTAIETNDKNTGVDIVTVLDVSGSMYYDGKLDKLKSAMKFLVRKLDPVHRLSIITFAHHAKLVCPLRRVTEDSQVDFELMIDHLVAHGSTNTTAGIEMALQVLRDRRYSYRRSVGIMLMSDGQENDGKNASMVPGISEVPVFTFGFGTDQEPEVLQGIAAKSHGGTFSDVQNMNDLGKAFSQCLALLLTLVVQKLEMTLIPLSDTKIENVNAGNYPQSSITVSSNSTTISFGTLYHHETRKVIVELLLPQVKTRGGKDVLEVTYTYEDEKGEMLDSAPVFATVTRTDKITAVKERDEVTLEVSRLQTAAIIKKARIMADNDKLKHARKKLLEAHKLLDSLEVEHDHIETLKHEVQHLYDYMESPEIYQKSGRPFALSSELSHERQRLASRGHLEKQRLFATPMANTFLEQASGFEKNHKMSLPKLKEDVERHRATFTFNRINR